MCALFEDDAKDGRHFPTDSESPILIQYLQIYFSHPERSIQRSQVVQSVVSILSPNNKHWTHRTVRLWFNNNKKVFCHPTSSPAPPPEPRKEPPPPFSPPRKFFVPPRSLSAFPLTHEPPDERFHFAAPPHPIPSYLGPQSQPKHGSFAQQLLQEYDYVRGKEVGRVSAQLDAEAHITEKIAGLHEQRWNQIVLVQPARTSIMDRSAMAFGAPSSVSGGPVPLEVVGYELIESSIIVDDANVAVAVFDSESQQQRLHFGSEWVDTELLSPITSMAFDDASDLIWVNSGNVVKSFDTRNLRRTQVMTTGAKQSSRSAMTFWNDNLVIASGSTVLSWSRRLLQNVGETDEDFGVCLTLLIPSITALATVADSLVVASAEYHTAQVYARNGARVTRAIGHSSGITALHGFDYNQFLSGSADQTAKLWDVRVPVPVANILRHRGIVTALYGNGSHNLVVTGGTDGVVRGWDIRNFQHLFAVSVGDSPPQTIHYSNQLQRLTVIVSERVADAYYDLGKFGTSQEVSVVDGPASGILTFHFAAP
jgi:hypothetical protein